MFLTLPVWGSLCLVLRSPGQLGSKTAVSFPRESAVSEEEPGSRVCHGLLSFLIVIVSAAWPEDSWGVGEGRGRRSGTVKAGLNCDLLMPGH